MLDTKWMLILAVLGWTLAAGGQTTVPAGRTPGTRPQFDPEAVRILQQALKVYQAARTYQDQSRLILRVTGPDNQENAQNFDSKLIFARPNKIRYVWPSLTLVCDGRQCLAYYPDLPQPQYTLGPAPAVITRAFFKGLLVEDVLTLVLDGLIDDKPFEQVAATIEELKYNGTVDENGRQYHRLAIAQGTNQIEAMIDAQTLLFHSMTLAPRKAKGGKWSLTVEYRDVTLNRPIDPAVFAIAPPAGARKVERISLTRDYEYKKLGQTFPNATLEAIDGGKPAAVGGVLGSKLTFVVFWATWCAPCREELPELQELYRRYRERGFQIVGISVDPEAAKTEVRNFVTEMNLTFPCLWDPESKLSRSLEIPSIPAVLMLDGKGKITQVHVGVSPDTSKEYQWTIERELGRSTTTQTLE